MEDMNESGDVVLLSVRFWIAKIAEGLKGSLSSIDKNILEALKVLTK